MEKTWRIDYVVGNTYKSKYVKAENAEQALKRGRVRKSVVDLDIVEYQIKDKYQLRDF